MRTILQQFCSVSSRRTDKAQAKVATGPDLAHG
jgi:hypothetical protein